MLKYPIILSKGAATENEKEKQEMEGPKRLNQRIRGKRKDRVGLERKCEVNTNR